VISAVIIIAIIDQIIDIKNPCEIHVANRKINDKRSMNMELINKTQRGI